MALTLHTGTVGVGRLFLLHGNRGLRPRGLAGELGVVFHLLLLPQLSPIGPYVGPSDPLVNTNPLAWFLSLHQSAATAILNVQRDRPEWLWHNFPPVMSRSPHRVV